MDDFCDTGAFAFLLADSSWALWKVIVISRKTPAGSAYPVISVDALTEQTDLYDAALIWASNGKDEDYMFGYSESELESAL